MKLLASITIVMAIPTIISGFFGMNVGIPLENMRGAFYIICGGTALTLSLIHIFMGEAAIQAGIIGAPVVIIIAFTAVSSFVVPMLSNEVTMLRWIFLFLGGLLGGCLL